MSRAIEIAEQRFASGEISESELVDIISRLSPVRDSGNRGQSDYQPNPEYQHGDTRQSPDLNAVWNRPESISTALNIVVGIYILLSVYTVFALISTQSIAEVYEFLSGSFASSPTLNTLSIIQVIVSLIVVITCCVALYRLATNLEAMGISNLAYSPGWTVGWFFVPVAFLWKPVGAVSHLWRASSFRSGWADNKGPAGLIWWFVMFWLSIFIEVLVSGVSNSTADVEGARGAYIIALVIGAVSLFIFSRIIRGAARAQSMYRQTLFRSGQQH